MHLTLAHISARKDSKLNWFVEALAPQIKEDDDISLVVVNPHIGTNFVSYMRAMVKPKPCVWQGEHRLTKQDWFAASNARNTALCLAPDGWIAYVDDLSVPLPTWLESVRQSMREGYIALGAYRKVRNLKVEDGKIISFEEFPAGVDSRLAHARGEQMSCGGDWLYGCSLAGPVEAFLSVNGWPEMCDGMGFEDACMGICLGNTNRWAFRYDTRMMTYESEEMHYAEPPLRRSDYGVSPRDKSHSALNIAKASTSFPNTFDIREMRDKVLKGEPFPIILEPRHDWYTGKPLSEL